MPLASCDRFVFGLTAWDWGTRGRYLNRTKDFGFLRRADNAHTKMLLLYSTTIANPGREFVVVFFSCDWDIYSRYSSLGFFSFSHLLLFLSQINL